MSNNVVVFPKAKRGTPPQSLSELYKEIQEVTLHRIEYVCDVIMEKSLEFAESEGFAVTNPEYTKDLALVVEAYRSLLMKTQSIDHTFHEMVQEMFTADDEDEEGLESAEQIEPSNETTKE